ncbi:hypothetical protein ACJRO7_009613 [Eucalyptus globulus]|uniref:Uncharacterized protein n=1 Tax=Eucalyptus globulus TaxID=34317 RepID=A0ABD3L9B5_EUCGL
MSPNCPKVSIFLLTGDGPYSVVIPIIPNSFFKQLWGLKVLNLSRSNLRELPDSISDLVNLRALLLRCCWELCRVPYLGKLASLRKLDVFSCTELEEIKGLEMLVELRYLDIGYTRIKRVPEGALGALRKLQYLRVEAVNEEDIVRLCGLEALGCEFEDVDDFNKLVRLVNKQSNNPRYYKLHLDSKQWLEHRDVVGPFRNSERSVPIEMETMSYAIVRAGRESSGSGSGSGSGICILIPQNVRTLSMTNCDGATNLSDMGLLENLETLIIGKWKNLRVLSGRQDEEIINLHDSPTPTPAPFLFLSLGDLTIYSCLRLKYLFGHGPKFYLPHLRRMKIVSCKERNCGYNSSSNITITASAPSLP